MPREVAVTLKVDHAQALRNIQAVDAAAANMQKNLGKAIAVTQSSKASEQALSRLGQSIGQVSKAQLDNINAMRRWVQTQDTLRGGVVKANGAVSNAAGSFQKYKVAVNESGNTTRNFTLSVNTATGEVYQLDTGVRSVSNSLQTMTMRAKNFIAQTVGFNGLAQSMRYAFTEMKKMSDEMITYQKVTGASGSQLAQVRASAYSSAKAYGKTPSDYLSSVSEFARAGYKETSAAMADLATKTQLVGDMSAEMASSFLLATDAGYKLQGNVEKLNKVLDSANVIDNRYATSIEKIAEGMTLTASLANQVNMPIEQLMAGLGTMTAVTQRSGSEMGRALRSVMLTIMKDTTAEVEEGVTVTQEQIESLNDALNRYASDAVRAANATGKLLNPMEALGSLAQAYREGALNDQSLTGVLSGIGGERYSNALISLVTNWDEVYTKMLGDIATAAGSADAEVTAMTSGWTAKFNILKTTWTEVVNDTISEDLIKRTIDFGTGILESAGNLENLTLVAGGAHVALKNLNNAMKNGGFTSLTKWGTGLGLGIAAVGVIKGAYDNYYAELQESAEKAAAKAVSVADEVKTTTLSAVEALKELRALDEDGNGYTDNNKLQEAKTLHEEIVKLIGEEAAGYNVATDNINEMTEALAQQIMLRNNEALSDVNVTKYQVMNNFAKQVIGNKLIDPAYQGYAQNAGLMFDTEDDAAFLNMLDQYSEHFNKLILTQTDYSITGRSSVRLNYKQPSTIEDAKALYEDLMGLQGFLASDLMPGTDQAWAGSYVKFNSKLNDFIAEYEKILQPYLDVAASEDQLNAMNLLLGDGLWSRTFDNTAEFDKHIDQLIEAAGAEGDYAAAIREAAASFKDLTLAKEKDGDQEETKNGFESVAEAIEKATSAKKAFDEAMKTTMADGLNSYQEAFETLKKEIDEGRVNSTAAHAAYRMLLGDEAYAATGGNAQMLKSMYAEAEENYKTLFASYKNEHGDVVQGGGVLKIAEQAGLNVRDANGNYRYDFTAADVQKMSNYSKLSTELLMSALGALEQYDQKGINKELLTGEASPELQATNDNTAATTANTTAIETLSGAIASMDTAHGGVEVSGGALEDKETTVDVEADTENAEAEIDRFTNKKRTAKVQVDVQASSFSAQGLVDSAIALPGYADGTDGHPGGLALVNDGTGSNAGGELIVQNGRAFIAGGGSPALVNLQRGARVFSASETRKILSGGVRSYAQGSNLHSTGSGAWGNGYVASGSSGVIGGSGGSLVSGSTGFGDLNADTSNSNNQSSSSSGTTYKKFSDLAELMDYIIERLGKALEEQVEAIDGQIQALREAREASDSQKELEERQEAVAEAQKDLQDAMNERTVRVLNDDGTWSWQSDSRNVEKAKETLKDAEDALKEYQDDLAFEAQVNALEAEKERLQKEYAGISDAWSEIQSAVSTPKGNLSSVLASILKGGSATDKTGAKAVQELLIGSLLTGGSYSGNYQEALDALSAAVKGSPVMPTESGLNLAQLIASSGTGASDALLAAALAGGSGVLGASGSAGGSSVTQIGDSYYFNGVQIGSDMLNRPLSEIIRQLTVYTNT